MSGSGKGKGGGKARAKRSATPPQKRRPTVAEERAAEQANSAQTRAARDATLAERFGEGVPGRGLIVANLGVTIVVAVISIAAVAAYTSLATPTVILDIVVFVAGLVIFVAALVAGAQRSRDAEMDVAGWFFLSRIAPPQVQRTMLGSLAVQVVVGIGAALASHGAAVSAGDHASKLAFGTLVPIFGLAMCGLWGARYGAFPPRRPETKTTRKRT
jgi:hypothetical protein